MDYSMEYNIWKPISFDEVWNDVITDRFDNIRPSWERRRQELQKDNGQYKRFLDQLKRKQAVETGILERMYDLRVGITETFIKKGFVESYLQHGDTDIPLQLLMAYLRDNFEAVDGIFDFVKQDRELSTGYIKELHQVITKHQDYSEAIDQFGKRRDVAMLKGLYKKYPNNPVRDGVKYNYCPPEQVASEMDRLIDIYNNEITESHVLVRAAYFHHAFVQIHPFQDGNGRLARLLASLVLIKDGLFPLSIGRDTRIQYIDALEKADHREYQAIVDIFADNQIASVEQALNWRFVDNGKAFDDVVSLFGEKLSNHKAAEEAKRQTIILFTMRRAFVTMNEQVRIIKEKIEKKAPNADVSEKSCSPDGEKNYYFTYQITEYAKDHGYYVNLSLARSWSEIDISFDKQYRYRLVFTLHHYGYDDCTFAIGSFLIKEMNRSDDEKTDRLDIPLGIPPLTFSSETDVSKLIPSISQQVELSAIEAIAYISDEISV